jgi:dipeptidyl aminopeptidase/acylaminoacyl peptidase
MRFVGISTAGEVRTIIEEQSPTFIDYSQKTYLHRLPETDQYLWSSERDGWNHLYLYDARTGESRQVTRGKWVVREVDRVDAEKQQVWFRAGGIRPEQDPYHLHYCRVNFDGSGLVILTDGDGTHSIQPSPDGETFVDTYSRVDLPPVTELRSASDGALIAALASADASELLSAGWRMPERFVATGRDGETDIWGMILRPTNFDPEKKYPVIEYIYAGPHGAHVPKEFRSHYGQQELAELGFILVMIDGMGTNHRGKAFHDVAWKNIADAGFPDRVLWIKAAAGKEPAMDITKVGIYGGSAGGQNAMRALLDHNDFYDAAVADCGCHDNRMDKIWWNEAWMGWPVDKSYEKSSNVVDAHKLEGKLLLVVGEADENVDPSSTLQVVDALIRADKDFEFLLVPGAGHGALGNPYARRRMWDFFVRNLLEVEPRSTPDVTANQAP